jgi:hypothetical protein
LFHMCSFLSCSDAILYVHRKLRLTTFQSYFQGYLGAGIKILCPLDMGQSICQQ